MFRKSWDYNHESPSALCRWFNSFKKLKSHPKGVAPILNMNAKYEEVQEMEYMGLQLELISQLGWMKQIGYSKEGSVIPLSNATTVYSANNNPSDTYG